MVLGIIGMVYALVLALAAFTSIRQWQTQAFMGDSVPFYFPNPAKELLGSAVSISLMPLLALVFALISKHLGYRCKVSSAGLIMGSIGIAICTIASLYLIQFL
ncbi:MAG: hypothetical protein IJB11_05150 [Oscillospiraceae bacterium]|nr:hypothetical protein [Oscillospiraceae bacterium]